jgi:hypothetical protein
MCCACRACIKCCLFPYAICFLISGLLATACFVFFHFFAYWVTYKLLDLLPNVGSHYSDLLSIIQMIFDIIALFCLCVAILLIGAGVVCIFVACCEIQATGYAFVTLMVFFVTLIAIGGICWFATEQARITKLKTFFLSTIKDHFVEVWQLPTSFDIYALGWTFFMYQYQCCGLTSPTDFQISTKWNRTYVDTSQTIPVLLQSNIPFACCQLNSSYFPVTASCPVTMASSYASNPCYNFVYAKVAPYWWVALLFFIGIGVFFLVPAVLALLLIFCAALSEKVSPA